MRINFLLLAAGLAISVQATSKDFNVKSPDNRINLTVEVNDDIKWSVTYNGVQIITPSTISMTLDNRKLPGVKPFVIKAPIKEINTTITPVVPHKNSTIINHYREIKIQFRYDYALVFRVYNDGVAYRFITSFSDDITVENETFTMVLPSGTTALYPLEKSFMSHNECAFFPASMDTIGTEHLASLPALFKSNGINVLLTESDLQDYPGMWIAGDGHGGIKGLFPAYPAKEVARNDRNVYVTEREEYIARTKGTRSFPWRVAVITPDDGGLVESDLVYCLAAPSMITDTQWIKPGKVAWDWYNANNLYGVDFVAGLNNETYKYYIDFAAENGIEYVILDEGWYKLGDVLDVAEGFDIGELCKYAGEKNVGIILWVVWKTFYDKMDEALKQYEAWGVKGIKVDFMQRDDQWMVNYYHQVAAKAAEHHMLVDFHGAYKPVGMERTWPNVITSEGVKGLENNKWDALCNPEHDVTLPFTRMVAGPMDYTPGAMRNMQQRDFTPVFYRPASQGTRVHQMAMYVVYESPLMMLADSPSNYKKEQECTTFIAGVPVIWDETKVLSATAGDYIIIARRKGSDWFIGAMTDWSQRKTEADLSFLPAGAYTLESFSDGINANNFGEDYSHRKQEVKSGDKVKIEMARGGGWVAKITMK